MKTLDEVIAEHEDDWLFDEDALHYLKEYRQTVKWVEISAEQFEQTREFIRKATANDPLTWDELRTMEGKPVWVVESAENGLWWTYWVIWQGDNAVLPKKDYSTKWQAYRKERS